MTIVPGFTDCHNHAPRRRRCSTKSSSAIRSKSSSSPSRSIVDKLRAKAQRDAAGHVGRGLLLRRHQGEGQARAQRARPRRGVEGPSGRGPASRRPHVVLQQQGARDGGRHEEHAESRRAAPSTATRTASSTAASPIARAACSTASASGQTFTAEQTAQRDRDGLALHLQAVRPLRPDERAPRGRRSARAAGGAGARRAAAPRELRGQRQGARGDDRRAASRPASATSGSGSARPPSTRSTGRSPSARWR